MSGGHTLHRSMRVVSVSQSDLHGGAARAAYRIHQALREAGTDATMAVNRRTSGDWTVATFDKGPSKLLRRVRGPVGAVVTRTLRTTNTTMHSPAVLPSEWPGIINRSSFDLVHLHWTNWEMMSVGDIGAIRKPLVWTLHDMWAFCGAEHYPEDFRWRDGYGPGSRPAWESGFDLNRWTWRRKQKHWRRPIQIVTPSNWLARCVRESALMRDWPVTVVGNAIDTDVWQPVEKGLARELLGLPKHVPLLLFGALGGEADPRKGFDLLRAALRHLRGEVQELALLVFGQLRPREPEDLGFPVHYAGHLHDDVSLRLLYSATDAMVIPSRMDNLPNTGVEAHACGTPVVAFDTGGLPDIVEHRKTGYLAKEFDAVDLARGIRWVLERTDTGELRLAARQRALARWSNPVVARNYMDVYRSVLAGNAQP